MSFAAAANGLRLKSCVKEPHGESPSHRKAVSFDGVALIETFQSDVKDYSSLTKVVASKLSNPIMVEVLTPKRRLLSHYAYAAEGSGLSTWPREKGRR